ncbi:MAG: polysaccharide deacetylase family protein [Candidatus Paceibacterota bacterium]
MPAEREKISVSAEVRLGVFLVCLVGLVIIFSPKLPDQSVLPVAIPERYISSREIIRGDVSKKQVIFTFDGGDGSQSAEKILEVLAQHQVKGSFFLTGRFVEKNVNLVKKIATEGHEIYSHTYSHPRLPELTNGEITQELKKTEEIMQSLIGVSPKPYFRAPYGDRDRRVLTQAFLNGYQSVYWTVDARDWQESTGMTIDQVKAIVLDNLAPGNIYLMHLGDNITGQILDELFTTIENRGYRIVSLLASFPFLP